LNPAGANTLLYTSLTPSSGTLYGAANTRYRNAFVNCIISYDKPALTLSIGNVLTSTGKYDPGFIRIETETIESISILLNGTPATVVVSDAVYDAMTVAAPGEVVVNGEEGTLHFNVADVGKTVTGQVTMITDA